MVLWYMTTFSMFLIFGFGLLYDYMSKREAYILDETSYPNWPIGVVFRNFPLIVLSSPLKCQNNYHSMWMLIGFKQWWVIKPETEIFCQFFVFLTVTLGFIVSMIVCLGEPLISNLVQSCKLSSLLHLFWSSANFNLIYLTFVPTPFIFNCSGWQLLPLYMLNTHTMFSLPLEVVFLLQNI